MKISVAFILIFIFCICYCSLGTTYSTSITIDNTVEDPETSTNSENSTNNDEHPILEVDTGSSEGVLNFRADSNDGPEEPSNNEDGLLYPPENDLLEVAQNSGVVHEVISPSLDIIHSLGDTATLELQDKAEELSASPTISETSHYNSTLDDNFIEDPNIDKDVFKKGNLLEDDQLNDSDNNNQTEKLLNKVPSTEPKINITAQSEEIPSFSEWTQRQLEEAERKKEEVNSSVQNQFSNGRSSLSGKKRWKNYASPDCGAKIAGANSEAVNPNYVLTTYRDEYKLNICNTRIWFVVELCEPIQAKKIELANFELFSSSPKDFTISISDRYSNRDWSVVGHFTAKDERDIQSFDLNHNVFGKFIKFEMHSHHGSEHYCPISLFRVFGTSEIDVLETENQINGADDDDDDETLDSNDGEPPKNLFSSATDAVISIVKKAAEALGNKGNRSKTTELPENKTTRQYLPLVNSCTTPSHVVICENCTDLLFGYVYELLSCKAKELGMLVNRPFIKKTLYNSNICLLFGLEWKAKPSSPLPDIYKNYMVAFFAPKYIAALCNTVAIMECQVVLNVSHNATIIPQNVDNIASSKTHEIIPNLTLEVSTTETAEFATTISHSPSTSDIPVTTQIKPTKTITPEENMNLDTSDVIESDAKTHLEPIKEVQEIGNRDDNSTPATEDNVVIRDIDLQVDLNPGTILTDEERVPENSEGIDDALDTLVNELTEESTSIPVTTISPPTQPQQQQKESVFLRLSNRLKALELNMSLSGQYLEELSRRYKKQVEEMQRVLDKTILTLDEDNRKKEERAEYLEQQIQTLKETVETLIEERNSWVNVVYWFIFIVTITVTVLFCKRNTDSKQSTVDTKTPSPSRRKSISVVTHKSPKKKKRRPSEEALLINGTYKDLLINNDVVTVEKPTNKKRKRKKPKLHKSNSVSTLTEESPENEYRPYNTIGQANALEFAPKLTSSRIFNKPECQYMEKSTGTHSTIQDIPFVLEESEHSSLERLPNNLSIDAKDNIVSRPSKFTVTTVNSSSKNFQNSNHSTHKKSESVDSRTTERSSSPTNTYVSSVNGSLADESLMELPRKEKKHFLRRIFKNLTVK